MMDIRTLRYFVEVVRQQSFTRAAEALFVTQPTISKMLSNLESELNNPLLIRNGRRLILTDIGQAVYQHAQIILAQFNQLEEQINDINQLKSGVLRLGIPPMVGTMVADAIGLYRSQYPKVSMKISEFGGVRIEKAVRQGELDVAITALPLESEDDFTVIPLFNHPLRVLVAKQAPWLGHQPLDFEALAQHDLVIYNEDFSLSRMLMKHFNDHGLTPRIAVRSGQWDFLAAMVEKKIGIAILPEPICQRLKNDRLMWLPLNSELTWRLGIIWRKTGYLSQATQAWVNCCQGLWPAPHRP